MCVCVVLSSTHYLKEELALIIFDECKFKTALVARSNPMACFIASKCFAAKTGFPSRWWCVSPVWIFKMSLSDLPLVQAGSLSVEQFPVVTPWCWCEENSLLLFASGRLWMCFTVRGMPPCCSALSEPSWPKNPPKHLENSSGSFHSLLVNRFLIYTRTHFVQFC